MNMNFKKIITNIFFSLFTFFLFFEIILFFCPVREPSNTIKQTKNSILKLEPNRIFQYSKGGLFQINTIKKTNNYGYTSNFDYKINEADILVIGDSFVEAMEVNNNEAFHHILNEKLNLNVYQLSHSSSNLSQYYKFAEFGVENFKPKIIIYNIVANDYTNQQAGKYNFDLKNKDIFLNENYNTEKKLIHKILLKSGIMKYLYYNLQPHHKINYLLNNKKKKFEGNISCEYTDEELKKYKKTFDLFLEYNQKFVDEGIDVVIMFDEIRSKIYQTNINNCGFNDQESGLAFKIKDYSVKKQKNKGIYTLDLGPYFVKAYKRDQVKFEFINDLHWNKYAHRIVSLSIIDFLKKNLQ